MLSKWIFSAIRPWGTSPISPASCWCANSTAIWRRSGWRRRTCARSHGLALRAKTAESPGRRGPVEQATMTATLNRMERDGLVARRTNPQDGRSSLVALTPEATEKLPSWRDRRQHQRPRAGAAHPRGTPPVLRDHYKNHLRARAQDSAHEQAGDKRDLPGRAAGPFMDPMRLTPPLNGTAPLFRIGTRPLAPGGLAGPRRGACGAAGRKVASAWPRSAPTSLPKSPAAARRRTSCSRSWPLTCPSGSPELWTE